MRTRCVARCWTCPAPSAGDGIDRDVAAHYGSFNGEQRTLESGEGFVDLSHRDVVRVSGPDRLTWLHSLTTQHLEALAPEGVDRRADPQPAGPRRARVLRRTTTARRSPPTPSPARPPPWSTFLDRMRFMMRVEVADVTDELAVTWRPSRRRPRARTPATSWSRATSSRRTPRRPARPAACGRSRRCGSRAASPGSASTPTTARSPTRPAGSAPPSTSTRAATAARRRSPGCTPSAARRAG